MQLLCALHNWLKVYIGRVRVWPLVLTAEKVKGAKRLEAHVSQSQAALWRSKWQRQTAPAGMENKNVLDRWTEKKDKWNWWKIKKRNVQNSMQLKAIKIFIYCFIFLCGGDGNIGREIKWLCPEKCHIPILQWLNKDCALMHVHRGTIDWS